MGATQVEMLMAGLVDASGDPLAGGKVYSYSAGTVIAKALYTDKDKGGTATNPVILDSLGQAEVWGDGSYKFVITDADDVTIQTIDGLAYGTTTVAGTSGNVSWGGTSTNISNAYSINVTGVSGYTAGDVYAFIVNATNTGAATLNVTGAGAKGIKKEGSIDLGANDLVAGSIVIVTYDATAPGYFQLVANSGKARLTGTAVDVDIWTTAWGKNVNFGVGGTKELILGNGDFSPNTDLAFNLGQSAKRYNNVYLGNADSGAADLILKSAANVKTYANNTYFYYTNTSGHIVPVTAAQDLGTSANKFQDLHMWGTIRGPNLNATWTLNDAAITCGTATIGSTTGYEYVWFQFASWIMFQLCVGSTFSGSGYSNVVTINLPTTTPAAVDHHVNCVFPAVIYDGTSYLTAMWRISSGKINIYKTDLTNFAAKTYRFNIEGKYKAV